MTKKTKALEKPEQLREPREREKEAIAAAKAIYATLPIRPDLAVTEDTDTGALQFDAKHTEEMAPGYQLAQAFASQSNDFVTHQLLGIVNVVGKGEQQINSALALIAAVGARDELEAALAVQIAATHNSALAMLMHVQNAKTIPALSTYGNLATKFQRTLTNQIEALAKLRSGGVQTVRHVHVNEGGQAIITDQFNSYRGMENENSVTQSHTSATGDLGAIAALPSPDALGNGVPISSCEGQEAVPHAWGNKPGCT